MSEVRKAIPKAIINGRKFKARELRLSEIGTLALCALFSTGLSTLLFSCKNCSFTTMDERSQVQCHKLGGVWNTGKQSCQFPPSLGISAEADSSSQKGNDAQR